MADTREVIKWMGELDYSLRFFRDAKPDGLVQSLSVAAKLITSDSIDYLTALSEHADELKAACQHLIAMLQVPNKGEL